jgi:double-stranded uracil-DNA glycosylase
VSQEPPARGRARGAAVDPASSARIAGVGVGDLLAPGLDIVFVGFNPSLPAWRIGHYYANPGNQFYRLLHESGLTPRRLRPEEDADLLGHGIGATDLLAGVPSARAADRPARDYRAAREALRLKLEGYAPRVVCFNGLGVFTHYFGEPPSGLGPRPDRRIGVSQVAVTPSSSGLANGWAAERLAAYRAVAALLGRGPLA